MNDQAPTCPVCAAPVDGALLGKKLQEHLVCLYCNTLLHATPGAGGIGQIEALSSPPPKVIEKARQALLSGGQPSALRLLQDSPGIDKAEARRLVKALAAQMAFKANLGRQLGGRGWGVAVMCTLLALGSLGAVLAGQVAPLTGLLLALIFLALVYPFVQGIRTELRVQRAASAPAVVERIAQIGLYNDLYAFRALLEVQPENQPSFQTQAHLAARQPNLEKLHPGARLQVKILPQEPGWVVFERLLEESPSGELQS